MEMRIPSMFFSENYLVIKQYLNISRGINYSLSLHIKSALSVRSQVNSYLSLNSQSTRYSVFPFDRIVTILNINCFMY